MINKIVLTDEDLGDELDKYVGLTINLLLKTGYECSVREEETGIIVISFDYDRCHDFGNPLPVWLTAEQIEYLDSYKKEFTLDGDE